MRTRAGSGLLVLVALMMVSGGGRLTAQNSPAKIDFADRQQILASDGETEIVAKAAHVLPRPNQQEWMRLERTFFVHFGPNTFRGVEWGNGHEDPAVFNPTEFDADQWVRTIKQAGGRMIVLVTKHHDGMAMWPSRYTAHSVAASPWRGGKGSVVAEVARAAQKYGVELGVYLSPADLYQLRTNPANPKGYYGDGSKVQKSVIPTAPESFLSDPTKARPTPVGKPSFTYDVDDYNRYFLNQLYELLTEYGPIREVWFDGANPDPSVHESYAYEAWYSMIRKLQPKAMIFGKGPDARWVGNEEGIGRETEWSVIPLPAAPEQFQWPDMTDADLGSRAKLLPGKTLWWYPPEVDLPILYGWFWGPTKGCRTATELVDRYYSSVGMNANLILNLSPDRRGLIPADQVAQLQAMADVLEKTFAVNLATGAEAEASTTAKNQKAAEAVDGSLDSWWEAAAGQNSGELTLTLAKKANFDVVALSEAVDRRGQRVESFAVDARIDGSWQQVAAGTTIGHKRLLRLKEAVVADAVRVRITGARLEPTLAEVGLYKQPQVEAAPEIGRRDKQGFVSIAAAGGKQVVYTLDGSIPTDKSQRYNGPIDLGQGAMVMAATLTAEGGIGMVAEKRISGLAPTGWTAVETNGNGQAAVDDDLTTSWVAESGSALTIDAGKVIRVGGFSYLPSKSVPEGTIERYRFEASLDGKSWSEVSVGVFDNIRNNPVEQLLAFAPTEARYFRLTPVATLEKSGKVSAAEVALMPVTGK